MVIVDFGGDFVTYDSTKDGQMAVIIGAGEMGELTFQGKTKSVLNLPVEIDSKKMTFTPGIRAGKALQSAFGMDSKEWINKKFEIVHVDKKMIIRPIAEEKV